MADIIDDADDRIEKERSRKIEQIRNEQPVAVPTGFCLECDDPVPSGHRWCGPECRDAWARMADA